jgi:hypothetical protein
MFGTTNEATSDMRMTDERTIRYFKYWFPEYSEVSERGLNSYELSAAGKSPPL